MKSAPIAISQVWMRHPRPMLCARRKHSVLAASTNILRHARSTADDPICCRQGMTGVLQRGTFKNSTLGVFINSEWSAFGNSGFGHVGNSELGTTFGGHSELGAFGPGAQSGRKNQPACLCFSDRHFYPSALTDFDETWSQGPYCDLVWLRP